MVTASTYVNRFFCILSCPWLYHIFASWVKKLPKHFKYLLRVMACFASSRTEEHVSVSLTTLFWSQSHILKQHVPFLTKTLRYNSYKVVWAGKGHAHESAREWHGATNNRMLHLGFSKALRRNRLSWFPGGGILPFKARIIVTSPVFENALWRIMLFFIFNVLTNCSLSLLIRTMHQCLIAMLPWGVCYLGNKSLSVCVILYAFW